MRILHLINRYWPAVGGAETHLEEISARLAADGHSVTVATTDALDFNRLWNPRRQRLEAAETEHRGVRIRRFPLRYLPLAPYSYVALRVLLRRASTFRLLPVPLLFRLARFTPWVPGLWRWLKEMPEPFDLVAGMAVLYEPVVEAGWRYGRRRGVPVAIYPLTHLGSGRRPGADRMSAYYTMRHQVRLVTEADAVLAQTPAERDFYVRRGARPERVVVAGPGVEPERVLGGDGVRFRTQHGLGGPLVGFVGAMTEDKGAFQLVRAIELLAQAGTPVSLALAGMPTPAFQRRVARLSEPVRAQVRVLGRISDADKRDLLAACDLVAMPSRSDSFGISYLEAWLYGKPVIGARVYGVADVIDDGRDGLLVPFGDAPALAAAIERLVAQPAERAEMGAQGARKVYEQHTWDRKYALVRDVYARLAGKGG